MNEIEIKRNFARNIKSLRLSRKLNQTELGERIHYSSKAISKWENEDVLPDIVTLKMLADYFNISVDDLISNKNVIRKSHRRTNRILITISSCLLSFAIASIMFLVLYACQISFAWKAFLVAAPVSAITFIVFSALWFKKYILTTAVILLVISLGLMINSFIDFYYYWIFIIVEVVLSILFIIFFHIRFGNKLES